LNDEPPNRPHEPKPPDGFYPKAELLPRLLARLTDLALASILPVVAGVPGGILAALFLLFSDGILRGQSPGKKLLGIKVIHVPTRAEAGYRESALRNFPFALAMLCLLVPEAGQLVLAVAGAALLAFEGGQAVSDRGGLRLGDHLASTQVVDTKVVAGAQVRALHLVRSAGSEAREAARVLLEPARTVHRAE